MQRRPQRSPLFPYPTLSRSPRAWATSRSSTTPKASTRRPSLSTIAPRSEEHTSELQSRLHLLYPLFFLNATAPTEISTLSLPDALPISTSLGNLALLYHAQGQYAQAEPLYNRA